MRRASLLQPGGGCLKCAKLQAIVFALTSDVKRREDALSVLHEITNHKVRFARNIQAPPCQDLFPIRLYLPGRCAAGGDAS
mmetsp:Transcript_56357/g.178384  ORF Transcript_56357/g.178384 Transcript_56357/m.178384 type:complete len:81 (-) Transcript_56357:594-836(-)